MNSNPWIVHRTQNLQARIRLFCFHHAGGAANVFRGWQARLPKSVELCPVQLPGHSTRMDEPLVRRLDHLTEQAIAGLLPELGQPFAFFGHSMGGLLAFQIARELQHRGLSGPEHLFVAARVAPSVSLRNRVLHDLSDRELVEEIGNRYSAIPKEIANDPELLALLLPALRADFEIHETYLHRPGPPLRCPISVYGGTRDRSVKEEELDSWRQETEGRFSKEMFDGDHFFIHADAAPFMGALSGALTAIVRRANLFLAGA